MKRVGILFGMENTFPGALVARINEMNAGVIAENVQVGVTIMAEPTRYDLIIDRISQDVPYYRSYLKNAVLGGAIVVNNPFWWSADDKFFNYALLSKLDVAIPKTVLVPSHQHPPSTTSQSFRNMIYPIDWKAAFEYVSFPAFFKPHSGGGWKHVYKIHNESDFFHYYHQTADLVMTLQENIEFTEYFRCYCIGQEDVHVMQYDPRQPHENRYVKNAAPVESKLYERVVNDCRTICQALGYDINTIEFAVRNGIPYAIDFLNPAPDADYHSVGPENFTWMVNAVADFAVKKVLSGVPAVSEYRWASFLNGQSEARLPTRQGVKASRK